MKLFGFDYDLKHKFFYGKIKTIDGLRNVLNQKRNAISLENCKKWKLYNRAVNQKEGV